MPRSPSLVLTAVLVGTLTSPTVRGEERSPRSKPRHRAASPLPPTAPPPADHPPAPLYPPPGGASPPGAPPPAHGSQAGGLDQSSLLRQGDPTPPTGRRKALMIGGLTTLGGSYLLALLVVRAGLGSSNGMDLRCVDCKALPRLLIPIAGPWLAMPYGTGNDRTLFTLLGLAQATGVVLSIVGISQYVADGATSGAGSSAQGPRQSRSNRQMSFGLLPVRDGAFGFASARF